ncbi:nuclear pore glycoprotein p62 [Cotesia glomerata]|uniref:Nucleoporin NSP1-like C-terminal domain-containing protein n=1 Tax=Cotesia glomerata TaxID=32391 RepID=A0AAV7IXP7_COTGL|nr:nuclear pore glycoprotein p62 [Cotesia glomerata]XP_044585667.1 nuclear pore glycoprotein p62 [Cotesia glomerata]KAH0560485.1 hypothetical protein KQX54_005169 [Cotesia glomerata]
MSSFFDTTKNQANPPAGTFFGAGDAGRTLQPLTAAQPQEKPNFGPGITTLTFGSNPGTQRTQPSMVPSSVPTFNPPAPTSNVTSPFGMTTSTPLNLGSTPGFTLGDTGTRVFTSTSTGTTSSSSAPGFGSLSTSTPAPNVSLSNKLTLGSSATTGFNLPSTTSLPAATSAQLSLPLGAAVPSTTSSLSGFSLPGTTSAAAVAPKTTQTTGTTQTTLGTTTTVSSSSSSGQLGAINFCQLEESINKWTLELEEQEKVFMNQATQINAWDKLLIANGEKIVTLNQQVEKVKLEQQQLEHELDYVVGQQKELQDCLVPLEKELANISVSDPEREYTYRLSEKLDTQLKQMSEDLKEIIEHLNEANRAQDSSDPIVQIGKILNAHMNSLQWIDQRTSIIAQRIQQIDQMHQNFRQENERSFNLAYN